MLLYHVFLVQGLEFPWWPKPVEDLSVNSQSNGYHVQELPALIVFMEAADDLEQKEVNVGYILTLTYITHLTLFKFKPCFVKYR